MISLVMPFYRNPEQLSLQYRTWTQWSTSAADAFEIVIIDDGSPEPAADVARPEGLPSVSIYRVLEDRPWHQHGARNLGAHVAQGDWLLLTDMDHVLTPTAADALVKRIDQLDRRTAYFLHRLEADTLEPTRSPNGQRKPHPNSFVMTRDLYWEVGGYDEAFCGLYGTDGLFKQRLFSKANQGFLKKVPLVRYWSDIMPDSTTRGLPRKEGRKPGEKEAIMAMKAATGEGIRTLAFPWERVL